MIADQLLDILSFHSKLAAKSANTLDLHKLLETLISETVKFIEASSGSIMIFNSEENCLQLYVSSRHPHLKQKNATGPIARLPIDEGIAGKVFSTGKPIIVENISNAPKDYKFIRKNDKGSFVSLPLQINKKKIGVLNLNRQPSQPAFSASELKKLYFVDTFIAGLIEKENLLDTINQGKTEVTRLYELSCILSDPTNFIDHLKEYLKKLTKTLFLERAALIKLSAPYEASLGELGQKPEAFSMLASHKMSKKQLLSIFESVSARLKYQLLTSINTDISEKSSVPLTLSFEENKETKELFCLPILVEEQPSHLLVVSRKYHIEDIEKAKRHYRFLYLASNNLKMALEREYMFLRNQEDQEMLLENATRNKIFLEISKDLASTLDPYTILQKAFDQFRKVISFSSISILLFDDLDNNYRLIMQPSQPVTQSYQQQVVSDITSVFKEYPVEPQLSNENFNKPIIFTPQNSATKSIKKFSQTLHLPIIIGETVSGLIHLAKTEKIPFSRHDLDITSQFTGIFITSIKNALIHKRTEKLAFTDPLTELFNHRYFQETLSHEFIRAQRYKKPLSLMVIDIDFFKKFNDTYGHLVGDKVLKHVAKIFGNSIREQIDTVARYGGEEFAVILPETSLEGASHFADRIRASVEESKIIEEDQELSVTLSIGVSCTLTTECFKTSDLIEAADIALYQAKENGRNQVKSYLESKVKNV